MHKPDYISDEDAKMMRFVSSMDDLMKASFHQASVILLPRRVIGDFNALARWIDRKFSVEKDQLHFEFNPRQLSRLRDEMPAAEKFAATQILQDMYAIENTPHWRSKREPSPILIVLSSAGYYRGDELTAVMHHDTHAVKDRNAMGRILSCYNNPSTAWVRQDEAVLLAGESATEADPDFTYDLKPGVTPRSFRLTDIWRHAGANLFPVQPLPFVHTARKQSPGDPPRLLLVNL